MSLYPGTLSSSSWSESEVFTRQKRSVIPQACSGSSSFRLDVSCSPPDQKSGPPQPAPFNTEEQRLWSDLLTLPSRLSPSTYGGNSSPSLESATSLFHLERRSTSKSRVSLRAQPPVDLRVQNNPHISVVHLMFCFPVTRIQDVTKTINAFSVGM